MTLAAHLHPARFFSALRAIDAEAHNERLPGYDIRPALALLTAACCLLLVHYLKNFSAFAVFLEWLAGLNGHADGQHYYRRWLAPYFELLAHLWWGMWHVLAYALIPMALIRWVFREPLAAYGWQWGAARRYWVWYVLLATPIVGFAALASLREDFILYYPFYKAAHRSWFDLLAWEFIYLVQFLCLEFFFRGFMLHACKPAFGSHAIFIMVLPYLMIHFSKPWLEATGAILFGILLGVLALRSRSVWGGFLVHAAVALSMDCFALLRGPGLPTTWWP